MQITIPQKAFRAVELAMAIKDIRYYLCGMMLEHNGEESRLAATDGHRLHAVIVTHENALLCAPFQIILPAAMVKTICKAKIPRGGSDTVTINVDAPYQIHDDEGKPVTVRPTKASALLPDGTETIAALVDGKFPEYQRVIPDSFSGEVAQYNPEYVTDAMKSAGYWMQAKNWQFCADFIPGGMNCGGISVPGFVAVVMSRRSGSDSGIIYPAFKHAPRAPMPAAPELIQVAA